MDEAEYIEKMAELYQKAIFDVNKAGLIWNTCPDEFKDFSRRVMRRFLLLSAAFSQSVSDDVEKTIDKKKVMFAMSQANKALPCMTCKEDTHYRLIRKADNSIWPFCEKHFKEGLKNLVEMSP